MVGYTIFLNWKTQFYKKKKSYPKLIYLFSEMLIKISLGNLLEGRGADYEMFKGI